jgi:enoyl-[acyl-carrier protein] reductase I
VLLDGKQGIVLGVANEWSIAWGIARELTALGATCAYTYQNERFLRRIDKLLPEASVLKVKCDVQDDEDIAAAFERYRSELGRLDFVIHSVAYAQREDLEGRFLQVSRDGYAVAQSISAYSLVAVSRAAEPLFGEEGGSIVTMSYLGGERVVPNYNTMGIAKAALESITRYLAFDLGERKVRVNAISAGAIKTLAASGVKGFDRMLEYVKERAPLKRNITTEEVGKAAAFFVSDLSTGVTGQTLFVDAGYHAMGM